MKFLKEECHKNIIISQKYNNQSKKQEKNLIPIQQKEQVNQPLLISYFIFHLYALFS